MAAEPTSERELATGMIPEASAGLVRTVDGLETADWGGASLLPDWTRAHVVAHLALNAEGMARVLRGVAAPTGGDSAPTMYDSDEQRGQDIVDLAAADPSEIRSRLLAATTVLQEAVERVPAEQWETRVERTPGGRTMRVAAFPGMRWRELEIHHVDLDAGYAPSQWSLAFAEHLLDAMAKRVRPGEAFEVTPLDSPRTWVLGDPDSDAGQAVAVVTGPAADLAWWLTGRRAPDSVSSSRGELPTIEGW